MRLGFWNRLAVVAFVIGTIAGPSWYVLSANAEMSALQQGAYETCMAVADERRDFAAKKTCFDTLVSGSDRFLGWSEWRQAIIPTLILLVAGYLIIAGAAWVVRWVWRGRSID